MLPKGGMIGASVEPSTTAAPGVWSIREVGGVLSRRRRPWPTPKNPNVANVVGQWHFEPAEVRVSGSDSAFFINRGSSTAPMGIANRAVDTHIGRFDEAARSVGMSHSLRVNGSVVELLAGTSVDWVPGTGTITYELRCRVMTAQTVNLFDTRVVVYSDGRIGMTGVGNAELCVSSSGVFQFGTEAFLSLTRDAGNVWRVHYQGVQVAASAADSTNYNSSSSRVFILMGAFFNNWANVGYAHEARVTKGVALYSASSYPIPERFPDW